MDLRTWTVLIVGAVCAPACGRGEVAGGPRLAVSVAPLNLAGIGDADYGLAVYDGDELVWEEEHVTSDQFGDGRGSISYVGPCVAGGDNRVELVLHDLYDTSDERVARDTYQNPTRPDPDGDLEPLVLEAPCVDNRDTPVVFNLVILRDANQGFFDIAVNFEDIFCSAKLDCLDAQGKPLELLFDPATEERDTTIVLAFACTAGNGETTWLHYAPVSVTCQDHYYPVNPLAGPGNIGGHPPGNFQNATCRGAEQLPGLDKCYWNVAIGLSLGPATKSCHLHATATASDESWLPAARSPETAVYPYVEFDADLTNASGALVCGHNPLNGLNSGVRTRYTQFAGAPFPLEWKCGDESPTQTSLLCSGLAVGQSPDEPGAFTHSVDGWSFAVGGAVSQPYRLEAGKSIVGCCANPCRGCSQAQ